MPGLISARRAAALRQIAQAKRSKDPSEVLALLRAAEKFFKGSRPQLTQQIANLEAEEAQLRQTSVNTEANVSKPAQELEREREPKLPEPQPEPEPEPPDPATRSVEAQGQTDALMSFSSEKKPKKRKQKQRKQKALVMPTSTPEPLQNHKAPVLPLEAAVPELPKPEPDLRPELSELPEFQRLAELLRRLGLAQHLPMCIEHEFDMDTLLTCGAR